MDIRFQPNNTHWDDPNTFASTDPHLKRLYKEPYVFRSPLIDDLCVGEAAILTLGGGRQIGKTTLLKQWILELLKRGVPPRAICFYSGELIQDHQALFSLMREQLAEMPPHGLKYFILDEVTDIYQWDKTIKYLADLGELEQVILLLSGSDLVLIQDARKRFPGRRGQCTQVDFHYYPLSFREFLQLKKNLPEPGSIPDQQTIAMLYGAFDDYLTHGGFLRAINDYAQHQKITTATFLTYSDWIRGDLLKRKKRESSLKEIIQAIVKHYTKQISWDNLVQELTIDHVQTVADYIELLGSMDAVFVQSALLEDKLLGAPKKRKKLMFCDPFIYHAMRYWLKPLDNPYEKQVKMALKDPILYAELAEACVITHFRRFFPTYYIKAQGEVDLAYILNDRFWPVEIKWTTQLRTKDLKQVMKYKNSVIYAKTFTPTYLQSVPVIPLPLALLDIPDRLPSAFVDAQISPLTE